MATINPRGRQLAQVSRAATQPARITQAARPTTSDPALNAWIGAMHEWRHVREGGGNPFEKVLTGRDLVNMGLVTSSQITNPTTPARRDAPGVVISDGQGGSSVIGYEQFAESIKGTRLFHDLQRRIDDPTRFDELHEKTRAALLEELAPIDGKIRGEIRRVEEIATSAKESLAQEVTTIRASIARASAGVRQVRAASANENRATAAQVTTVTARLDDFDGGGATVEETMTAIADRATGLEARYVLKVTAGGAMAGFGLASTDNGSGNATSAFIIQADKFAIVSSTYAGGLTNSPDVTKIPFGIDGTGIYMTGNVRIDGSLLVGTVTANNLDAATGTFSGSLSAATGTFSGDISGAANIDITGQAVFEGSTSTSDGTAAVKANSGGVSTNGIVASAGSGGYGVVGVAHTSGAGVWGYSVAGPSVGVKGSGGLVLLPAGSIGVYGTTPAASAYGVVAENTGGGTALRVLGNMTISSTTKVTNLNADRVDDYHAGNSSGQIPVSNGTVCTNLNADLLDGNHASAFATSGHNHSGVYLPVAGNAASATQLNNSSHTYTFSGGLGSGAATATFSSTTKPGANSSNFWMAFVIDGSTYYFPVWT